MLVFRYTMLLRFRTLDLLPYPAIPAYLQRIEQRPAYVKAGPGRKTA